LPIAILAAVGLAGGILSSPVLSAPTKISSNMTFEQPLLWYRLLPNATYSAGILLGFLLAAGPLVVILIWMVLSKRWQLNWLQSLAYTGACAAFLAMGLVASVKIGGGSDLHNLDMLLLTLVIVSGLMLRGRVNLVTNNWPVLARGLLFLAIFMPAWNAVSSAAPLQLPPREEVVETLNIIDKKVNQALNRGEVLFMDQRQLLTFGYLKDIPLVSEYEKKYMMDQAMAGNSEYFKGFYADMADKRFSLIITDPLFISEKGSVQRFGEENDAWTTWVAEPVLCYYAPVNTFPSVNVQLLVPKANTEDCPNGS
jgi:hypothetical protein